MFWRDKLKVGIRVGITGVSLFLLSGCVAMQEDVVSLQERVVQIETRFAALEKQTNEARLAFESDWNRKVTALSEEMLLFKEKLATTAGSVETLIQQVNRETEKNEQFRTVTNQTLLDFQRGLTVRLDDIQMLLDEVKNNQTQFDNRLEEFAVRLEAVTATQSVLQEAFTGVDTQLAHQREETNQQLAVLLEEISKENETLLKRIEDLEKAVGVKKSSGKK